MKITDPQVIEDGEKDLIEAVREDLDLDAVRQILKERMAVSALSSKGGQIVVHNNKIAFRLDFDINLSGSLLFDREGNYIDESEEDGPLAPEMKLDGFDTQDGQEYPFSDGIALVETGLNETELDAQDIDPQELTEMSINLPEYDLEEEPEYKRGLSDPDDLDEEDFNDQDLELAGLDDEILDDDGFDNEDLELDGLDLEDHEENDLLQEERLDDDINDILKESREFWEQKKDS